tara:strand:- start:523 stop:681 length:159 start_codon:yes stop_codon:yes gene_type:complete
MEDEDVNYSDEKNDIIRNLRELMLSIQDGEITRNRVLGEITCQIDYIKDSLN